MNQPALRVLMVCLGNICRSPLAEVVLQDAATQHGMADMLHIESAGTGDWHIGKGADHRSAATALQHGLSLQKHSAQQITQANIADWDIFVAMDEANCRDLWAMGADKEQVVMMRAFESIHGHIQGVPDPYYGGESGFEDAYQMLVNNTDGLLAYLRHIRSPNPQ